MLVSIGSLQKKKKLHHLLRYRPLDLEPVFAIKFSTQCILDLDTLRMVLGLNESV